MWERWKHKRILKGLKIHPSELDLQWTERHHEADAMPGLILMPKPALFRTSRWIMGHRDLPAVHGRLRSGV